MGDDLQKVTDVEVVVEQRARPKGHVQLDHDLRNQTNQKRVREDAMVSAVKSRIERQRDADIEQERHDVIGPGHQRAGELGLREDHTVGAEVNRDVSSGPEHPTDPENKPKPTSVTDILRQPKRAHSDDHDGYTEHARQRPGEGDQVSIVGHRLDQSVGR